jgi:hypothetical protein
MCHCEKPHLGLTSDRERPVHWLTAQQLLRRNWVTQASPDTPGLKICASLEFSKIFYDPYEINGIRFLVEEKIILSTTMFLTKS